MNDLVECEECGCETEPFCDENGVVICPDCYFEKSCNGDYDEDICD